MSSRGKQSHKKSTDIQKIERDKRKQKREELCNQWNNKKSNRKMFGEGHPDRAREQSESDIDRPELAIATASVTPDRSSDAQLEHPSTDDEPESMDYEESGPTLRTSPTPETSPRIREFLQQRLQIDDQSARLWYRMDDQGNLRDALMIVEPERNEVDNMIIQIKDLTDSTPLPNLISREEINYSHEATQPLERRLVEYKDQSSQTEDAFSILKKKQLFLEYHPIKDTQKKTYQRIRQLSRKL
jgi:hypothetical protein